MHRFESKHPMKKTCTSIVLGPYFCSAFVAMLIIACIIGGAAMALADPKVEHNSASSFEFAILPQVFQDDVKDRLSKISGADACGECHASEFAAWKQSTHFATWSTMHRNAKAKEIAKNMGFTKGIKRNDLCLTCHYTSRWKDEAAKPFAGVSCESCHGPAQDWIDVHKDYGGKEFNIDNETAEHKTIRLEACDKAGMLRSAQIYGIAKNCYSCHTVPNESLVNVGGHPAGSAFELVAWSQGEVRHNYSPDQANRKASAHRLRVLFVVGHLTDLEFSLRALAKAEKNGDYLKAMRRRVNNVLKRLDEIQAKIETTEVSAALAAVPRVEAGDKVGRLYVPKMSSLKGLIAVADTVSQAAQAFATRFEPDLAAIDSLLPTEYRGVAQN